MNTKTKILNEVCDLVNRMIHQDASENDLSPGDIEVAIIEGDITVDEICEYFRSELEQVL